VQRTAFGGPSPAPRALAASSGAPIQRFRSGGGGNPETGSTQAAQPDLHLIAQQVYRILKQRLLLERERAGVTRG
jgi:hypothetical protein